MQDINTICFALYLPIGLGLAALVTITIKRHGWVILQQASPGKATQATPAIRMLATGFFLLNAGNVVFTMGFGEWPVDPLQAINFLFLKIGWVLLILAATFYYNVGKVEDVCFENIRPPTPPIYIPNP